MISTFLKLTLDRLRVHIFIKNDKSLREKKTQQKRKQRDILTAVGERKTPCNVSFFYQQDSPGSIVIKPIKSMEKVKEL